MKLVLLSGGSGKRLWPLSNDARSKQFLRVLKNVDNVQQSMVQRVWDQLSEVNLHKDTVIATSKSQVDMIKSQLGDNIPLIVEPERRDTFPAIALAASYLYSIEGVSLDETVSVLPVDPYVENHFFSRVKDIEKTLDYGDADLALVGVKPTYPSAKYGYMVPAEVRDGYIKVSHFKEKPNESEAVHLIEQQALWNCGVFGFKLGFIIDLLKDNNLPIQYEELLGQYSLIPENSFDYEVVERTSNIVALPYEGDWKDLGTWNTLTEEMSSTVIGKGQISKDSEHTHLVNELDIPVNVLGVSNALVAASPDGILVTDKSASTRIKEMLKQNEATRPMYEERRWGWYKVLDYTKYDKGDEVLTKRICINKAKSSSYQIHYRRKETWTILKGEGQLAINDALRTVKPGDIVEIPPGTKHAIYGTTDLEFIEVQAGSELVEEDVKRVIMNWEEIKKHCLNKSTSMIV
ncbi:sugar phosphate nucleotidyltransferase [Tuberibacillus sp. Marseille-P3662]|uniref:sugar phosphate nucleotidyltransferase n=1 Tax=Tuberibacillus sp. Marseille-P3662 TaxID=1965358 RepID=UPI000A1CDAAA|nr:sugar phosphate nucleotidyltransferase [Tuberibacillus sp. Marseille-P3662]